MEKYAKSSGPPPTHESVGEFIETLKENSNQSSVNDGINVLVASIETSALFQDGTSSYFNLPVTLNNGFITETLPFFLSLQILRVNYKQKAFRY